MSAFICSSVHFNSVEQAIIELARTNNQFHWPYSFRESLPGLYSVRHTGGSIEKAEEEISEVMTTLRKLQALCVNLKYKHHYEGFLDQQIQEDTEDLLQNWEEARTLSPAALLKAITCIEYQIETEHLSGIRELTPAEKTALHFVKEFRIALAFYIVEQSEEYENADWSIDY